MLSHRPSALIYQVAATHRANLIEAAARARLANSVASQRPARRPPVRAALVAVCVVFVVFAVLGPRTAFGEMQPAPASEPGPQIELTISEIRAYQRLLESMWLPGVEMTAPRLTSDEMVFLDWNLLLPGGYLVNQAIGPLDDR